MKNLHNSRTPCPQCGKLLVAPMGNPKAPYLLVGDFPGYQEIKNNLPFSFGDPHNLRDKRPGDILRDELTRVGIMFNTVMITNLWQHGKDFKIEVIPPKTPRGKPKEVKVEACPSSWHTDELIKLFKNRTHVLLMGSEVTETVTGSKLDIVSGTKVKVMGYPGIHFWAGPNPSLLYKQPIGEWRLALERFSDDIKRSKKKTK